MGNTTQKIGPTCDCPHDVCHDFGSIGCQNKKQKMEASAQDITKQTSGKLPFLFGIIDDQRVGLVNGRYGGLHPALKTAK